MRLNILKLNEYNPADHIQPRTHEGAPSPVLSAEQMLRRAKKWSPYRSVAAWYMWRACDLDALSRAKTTDPATDMTK